MDSNVSFNLAGARVTTTHRSKGRMKIQFKLSKEQAEGFTNFQKIIKPPEMAESDFMLQVFFAGCNALTREIQVLAEQERAKQLEEAAKNQPSLVTETETAEVAEDAE